MITLKIGNEERRNGDIDERWIAQQFRKRKEAGISFCTRLIINQGSVNISLSAGACSKDGIVGRPPKPNEKKLIDLWDQKVLNGKDINAGMLISFLKQFDRLL